MKIKLQDALLDYYTDILSHSFESDGDRLAIGTSTGRMLIIERGKDESKIEYVADAVLPKDTVVLGLHWCKKGVLIGTKSCLWFLKSDDIFQQVESGPLPLVRFEGQNVNDVCSQPSAEKVFGACDDSKVRVWDMETQQVVHELDGHRSAVEVCNANIDYLVTGSRDGKIIVYDSHLRSKEPVANFDVGKQVVSGLDISQNSTWVAAGCKRSPMIYNLRNSAILPEIDVGRTEKIYAVHFDQMNNLWWAGSGNVVYRSSTYTSLSGELKATLGAASIHHVYSITSNSNSLSAAGSSTCILFSDNGDYWEEMVEI